MDYIFMNTEVMLAAASGDNADSALRGVSTTRNDHQRQTESFQNFQFTTCIQHLSNCLKTSVWNNRDGRFKKSCLPVELCFSLIAKYTGIVLPLLGVRTSSRNSQIFIFLPTTRILFSDFLWSSSAAMAHYW